METPQNLSTEQYHQKVMEAHVTHAPIKHRFWMNTILIAAALYVLLAYSTFLLDQSLAFLTFSKALGGTAALCFAISFSFSTWCYYFNFLDTKLMYRKYFGLVGYFIAMLYSFSLLIVNPERYFFGFFKNFWSVDFLLGLTAMAYFTFMALISNPWAIKKMTGKYWRWALRGGFLAWFLLALRAYVMEKTLWFQWFSTRQGFPPPRLLLSLLVIVVIGLRLSIDVSKFIKKNKSLPPVLSQN